MEYIRETYIHNHLILDEIERTRLNSALALINHIQEINNNDPQSKDTDLEEYCSAIIQNISKLVLNYSNEYPLNGDRVYSREE